MKQHTLFLSGSECSDKHHWTYPSLPFHQRGCKTSEGIHRTNLILLPIHFAFQPNDQFEYSQHCLSEQTKSLVQCCQVHQRKIMKNQNLEILHLQNALRRNDQRLLSKSSVIVHSSKELAHPHSCFKYFWSSANLNYFNGDTNGRTSVSFPSSTKNLSLEICALRSHLDTPFFLWNYEVPFVQHKPWVHKDSTT